MKLFLILVVLRFAVSQETKQKLDDNGVIIQDDDPKILIDDQIDIDSIDSNADSHDENHVDADRNDNNNDNDNVDSHNKNHVNADSNNDNDNSDHAERKQPISILFEEPYKLPEDEEWPEVRRPTIIYRHRYRDRRTDVTDKAP